MSRGAPHSTDPRTEAHSNNYQHENLRSSVPPPIIERSELGGSWRRLPEKKTFLEQRFPLSQSNPRFFVFSLFLRLRVKNWNWNWNNQKRIAIPVFIKEFGKHIKTKFNKYVNIEN